MHFLIFLRESRAVGFVLDGVSGRNDVSPVRPKNRQQSPIVAALNGSDQRVNSFLRRCKRFLAFLLRLGAGGKAHQQRESEYGQDTKICAVKISKVQFYAPHMSFLRSGFQSH